MRRDSTAAVGRSMLSGTVTNLSSHRGAAGSLIGAVVFAVLLAGGCGALTAPPGQAPIPSGSTVVHVVAGPSGVGLEPATVPAGDVYLVLDDSEVGSIEFVQRQTNPNQAPGPLNNGDLVRLGRGDLKHTTTTGLDAGGCDEDQNRQARGMLG